MKSVLALTMSLLLAATQLAVAAGDGQPPAGRYGEDGASPRVLFAQQGVFQAGPPSPSVSVDRPVPTPRGVYRAGPSSASGMNRPGRPPVAGAYAPGRPLPPGTWATPPAGRTPPPGGWARPRSYWWRPGAAIAAGVAMGVVAASIAERWAGPPPGPGYCWFHTDIGRSNGFWDVCP